MDETYFVICSKCMNIIKYDFEFKIEIVILELSYKCLTLSC